MVTWEARALPPQVPSCISFALFPPTPLPPVVHLWSNYVTPLLSRQSHVALLPPPGSCFQASPAPHSSTTTPLLLLFLISFHFPLRSPDDSVPFLATSHVFLILSSSFTRLHFFTCLFFIFFTLQLLTHTPTCCSKSLKGTDLVGGCRGHWLGEASCGGVAPKPCRQKWHTHKKNLRLINFVTDLFLFFCIKIQVLLSNIVLGQAHFGRVNSTATSRASL